ncbi:MAG: anhydro-N-acetylmuramic acid kinase [Pseudomonadota bacterium]
MTKHVAMGLMSGTSMDGVDIAIIETDGETVWRRRAGVTMSYPQDIRRSISSAIADAAQVSDRRERPGCLGHVERILTEFHGRAVLEFARATALDLNTVDVIGFHGQTVLHRPEAALTLQLGDGHELARTLGRPVAFDLRAADVEAGGQGAPLAPIYHRALVSDLVERPIAVLNIGGVANVTWIGAGDDDLVAFDTGPGNALLDDWMAKTVGASRDEGGAAALAGIADMRAVAFFLGDAFFANPPPKSLDRNAFFWDMITGLSVADGAATLVAMTVGAVARAVDHMPSPPKRWIVAGGGRHNRAMMQGLTETLGVAVEMAEAIGFDGDTIEAEAWAYISVRAKRGLPISYPGTTGAPHPMTGGVIARPDGA